MIEFDLHIDPSTHGWARLRILADDRALKIDCSNLANDCIRDWIVAFVNLANDRGKQEILCYSEPAETIITLRKTRDEVELIAKRFLWEGDAMPPGAFDDAMRKQRESVWRKARRSRNKKAVFRYKGPFTTAIRDFATSFDAAVKEIGQSRYEKTWGHPYPSEDVEALRKAVSLA